MVIASYSLVATMQPEKNRLLSNKTMRLEEHFERQVYSSKTILLVDDEKDLGWILRKVFRDAGHRLLIANTVAEGLQKFKRARKLDLTIVDLRVGKSSGISFIRKAKTIKKDMKFAVVTAFGTAAMRTKARRLGVRYFLDKPLKVEALLDIINQGC